jgi:hypothetical protein
MSKKNIAICLLLCFLLTSSSIILPAHAFESVDAQQAQERIEVLTKDILLKLIKLERFNLHYRLEVAKQGRWKGWRYFLSQEGNAAATEAGLIVGVAERMSNIKTPKLVRPNVLQAGLAPQIAGQFTGAGGSALEFAINVFHMWQSNRQGFSSNAAKQYVLSLRQEIDKLLDERDALVKQSAQVSGFANLAKIAEREGCILRDIRDLTLMEFVTFHVGTRRFLAFQQSLYLFDIAKNTTGAVGNIAASAAIAKRNRKINAPAGICTTISGALIVAAPLLSRATGMAYGAYDKWRIKKCVTGCNLEALKKLDSDQTDLQRLCRAQAYQSDLSDSMVNRLALYDDHRNTFLSQLQSSTKAVRAGNLAATENILTGTLVGGSKLANGICFTVAGYKYHNDVRMTNILIGTGGVSYMSGTAWSLVDNLRIQAKREWSDRKLRKNNMMPNQILQDRLKKLDEMESALEG